MSLQDSTLQNQVIVVHDIDGVKSIYKDALTAFYTELRNVQEVFPLDPEWLDDLKNWHEVCIEHPDPLVGVITFEQWEVME